jgi:hypothetical protein
MADLPAHPGTDDESSTGPGRRAPASSRARWVPVAGIVIAILLVLLVIALHIAGVFGPGGH